MLDRLSPAATQDIGLLISILHTSEEGVWRNVGESVRRLRPRWCSIAVDLWNRPPNVSIAIARAAVWEQRSHVLAQFSRVLFLDTASRAHVPSHVRPSFSYRLHWSASFSDPVARSDFGMHSEGIPELLIGVDADVEVPFNLPTQRLVRLLTSSSETSHEAIADAETRAHDAWLHGKVPPCSAASGEASNGRGAGASTEKKRLAQRSKYPAPAAIASAVSPCEVATDRHRPMYVSVRNLADLRVEKRTSFAELGMYFQSLGLGNCCGRQNTPALDRMRRQSAAAVATLSRGPWCPPSTFFVLHRRSLGRLLRSFQLWQKAWDAKALTRDAKRLRWEYVSCALLAPGEATLLLYYNFSVLAGGGPNLD